MLGALFCLFYVLVLKAHIPLIVRQLGGCLATETLIMSQALHHGDRVSQDSGSECGFNVMFLPDVRKLNLGFFAFFPPPLT